MFMTPAFQAEFVGRHLGPLLAAEQPGVKIIGFDHNKDRVLEWARVLYSDPEARRHIDGIGVHWYGGLHPRNLDAVHALAPDKIIIGTEACNCGGVAFRSDGVGEWWARGERLALDILEDLRPRAHPHAHTCTHTHRRTDAQRTPRARAHTHTHTHFSQTNARVRAVGAGRMWSATWSGTSF